MASLQVNYSISFAQSVRIGYKQYGTSDPYTYLTVFPGPGDAPYTISSLPFGLYQVEVTTICPNCSGGIYSTPVVVVATAE